MAGIIFWLCALFVVYVYGGYPLLIVLLAGLRRRPAFTARELPTVTLLIAAHNEEKVIGDKIENSLALDYPRARLQILIADDGSTDRTAEIVQSYAERGVEIWSVKPRRGKMAAINGAIQQARNQIVLFSDADNTYEANTLREMVKPFADPSVGGVSGARVVPGTRALSRAEALYWKYEELIKRKESVVGSCAGVAGDALAIRRDLYVAPPPSTINDDFFILLSVLKQGYRFVFAPEARSTHPVTDTDQGEIERRARMVAGRYQVMIQGHQMLPLRNPVAVWQVVSHKFLRPLVPLAVLVALIANIIAVAIPAHLALPGWLVLARPWAWITLTAESLFFLLAILGMVVRIPGLAGRLLYLPAFLLNSNYAALKGLYRYFSDSQTVFWTRPRGQASIKKGEASSRR